MQIRLCSRINKCQLAEEEVSERPYIGKIQKQSPLYCGRRYPNNVKRVICCCGYLIVGEKQHNVSLVNYNIALYSNSICPAYNAKLLTSSGHAARHVDSREEESSEIVTSLEIRHRLLASSALQC